MTTREYKAFGKKAVEGQTQTLIIIILIQLLVLFLVNWIGNHVSTMGGTVLNLLISGPLSVSMAMIGLKLYHGETVQVEDILGGFKLNWESSVVLGLTNGIFVFLWSLLLFVPGIIKSLSYSMSYYILAENPDMSAGQARRASMDLMDGNKGALFGLYFSYIGWFILSVFTVGIPLIFIFPRLKAAEAMFYKDISGFTPRENADGSFDAEYADNTEYTEFVEK